MFDVIACCLKEDMSKYLWKFAIFSNISVFYLKLNKYIFDDILMAFYTKICRKHVKKIFDINKYVKITYLASAETSTNHRRS